MTIDDVRDRLDKARLLKDEDGLTFLSIAKRNLYRDVLRAIADGKGKMPAHLAREALKAEDL